TGDGVREDEAGGAARGGGGTRVQLDHLFGRARGGDVVDDVFPGDREAEFPEKVGVDGDALGGVVGVEHPVFAVVDGGGEFEEERVAGGGVRVATCGFRVATCGERIRTFWNVGVRNEADVRGLFFEIRYAAGPLVGGGRLLVAVEHTTAIGDEFEEIRVVETVGPSALVLFGVVAEHIL